jgi:hypothetical protein
VNGRGAKLVVCRGVVGHRSYQPAAWDRGRSARFIEIDPSINRRR